ncbi:YciI family protein [Cellulomonas massiliensis]|uniref:YciI family protein n=1 Tax=Cellulomonas massiliensis TaxID=1465811 RepID=UPI0013754368|nr:YciI family protein [Cellulomonas massiliensis]
MATTTTMCLVLLYGDEKAWATLDDEQRARLDAQHRDFAGALASAGHEQLGGGQLTFTADAVSVRRSGDGPALPDGLRHLGQRHDVVEGPYAETTEQLGGYYLVRTGDVRGLAELVASRLGEGAEIRPLVGGAS